MATTKKTTKVKSKVTKTKKAATKTNTQAAKAPAKTTTKKATKKTTKATAVKAANKPTTKVTIRTTKNPLRSLFLASAALSAVLAVMAGWFMNQMSYQVFGSFLTKNTILSKTETVFAPAIRVIAEVELRWILVGVMVLSALLSLLIATRLRTRYEALVKAKISLLRWIDMAIVSALIVEVVALLNGVQDLATLKLLGGLTIVACVLGWLAERRRLDTNGGVKATYTLGAIVGVMPWVVIASYMLQTVAYGQVRSPWYVYAATAATFIGLLLYARNHFSQLKGKVSYQIAERRAVLISTTMKFAFAIVLIVGLSK
ncbi:MAG: heliorhodopsin HeR [Candidatus Saccharimonadales bacterium]